MIKPLENIRVAITENRYPEQLTQLLERQGATVYSCPLLRETPVEDAQGARRFLDHCESAMVDYIVFYTGVGVDFLFRETNAAQVVARSKIVARGPKAVNALKKAGVHVDLVPETATTQGILQTLEREDLKNKSVLIQLYGQENHELTAALESRGARVTGISLYEYTAASDTETIALLFRKILDGEIDAITFTSAMQAPFFFQAAAANGCGADVRTQLKENVIVVSVGDVTSRALREAGVEPHVVPDDTKMGPMVKALADFFEMRRHRSV